MSIVAISQTLGSLGDEIGLEVARSLAYEFADREIILRAAERFGERVTELEHVTEEPPSLWERFALTTQHDLAYVEAIIWEMAARDNVVFCGRGAPFILRPVLHALKVRITAPEPHRAKRVEQRLGIGAEAADLVRESDHERASRVRFLYQVEWDNPLLYDLVLNTDRLDVRAAARLIRKALRNERLQPTSGSFTEVRDQSFTARARAELLAHPITRPLQLTITCRNGHLSLSGSVPHEAQQKAAEEIVGKIPGLTRVQSDLVVISSHPEEV